MQTNLPQGYVPISAKGHRESVYALARNGHVLVSGGTEKAICVWHTITGSKIMKLRGHTGMWDLGQQQCANSRTVHTDSVWTLASNPTFSHAYSGGRDLSLYFTGLATRESTLLCIKENPIQQLAMHDDGIWVATTDSSIHRWPAEGQNPKKMCFKEEVHVYKEPTFNIDGIRSMMMRLHFYTQRPSISFLVAGSLKCNAVYSVLLILLILVEVGCAAFIFFNKTWRSVGSLSYTFISDMFRMHHLIKREHFFRISL
ncbi:putative transcription factor WD40-like family [Helianthus anomalus]